MNIHAIKSSTPGSARRRIRKACEPCRQRKVKCDGGSPCVVCSGYGYNCSYLIHGKEPSVPEPSAPNMVQQTQSTCQAHTPVFFKVAGTDTFDTTTTKRALYVLSEDHQALKPLNTRFTRIDSAIAFPRSLAISLNVSDGPRLHSFAWNTGTRPERPPVPRSKVFDYVTLDDVEEFSGSYFAAVHPIFGIVDRAEFEQQATHCWASHEIDVGFEAVLCGVMALGSVFSATRVFPYEAQLAEHQRLALEVTCVHPGVQLSVDLVAAWIMHALYLRLTTRPHHSWIASCMAMHTAEATGLHQEMSDMKTIHKQARTVSQAEAEARRRTFWVASSLNRYFACQYGRTGIQLQNTGCRFPKINSNDMSLGFIELVRIIPTDTLDTQGSSTSTPAELIDSLAELARYPLEAPPLLLFRADMAFCIYRKLRFQGIMLLPSYIDSILSITRSALTAAKMLANKHQQWWNITNVPFHAICVLIALNTMESLVLLPDAMETLQNVTNIYNTHLSREALQTAQFLVKAAEAKKRKELECIQRCLNLNTTINSLSTPQVDTPEMISDLPLFEWPTDIDLGWSEFLDLTNSGEGIGMDTAQHPVSWSA